MGQHLKSRLTEQETIDILERYLAQEIGIQEASGLLGLKRRGFFKVLKRYRETGKGFCLASPRKKATRQLPKGYEEKILAELELEKRLIESPDNPIRFYNYSYIKEQLAEKQDVKVSLPTIIARAKKTVIINNGPLNAAMTVRY